MPLHPEYEAMLAATEALDGPKIIDLAVADAREMFRVMQPPVEVRVGTVENTAIDGPGGQIPLRIYTPSIEGDGPCPVAMMFHGGGWVIGDLDTADGQSREVCAGAGCIVVSVDYRLAPEHRFPAAAEDCFAATCWASENCAALGGDPARLAVVGDSAGGNLAAVVTLLARDAGGPEIAAQVLAYPVTDGVNFGTDSYRQCAEGYMLTAEAMHWFWDKYARCRGARRLPRIAAARQGSVRAAAGARHDGRIRPAAGRGRGLRQNPRSGRKQRRVHPIRRIPARILRPQFRHTRDQASHGEDLRDAPIHRQVAKSRMPDESSVKTVVIGVGPEDGLGAQLCARFLARGHHVFMSGRSGPRLEALARKLGGNATAVAADATDESQVVALFDAVDAADGELKLAIYNVGNNRPGPIADMESRYFARSLDVGVYGAFLFGREAVRRLRQEPSAGVREGKPLARNEPSAGEREGATPRKKEPSAGERGGTLIFTGASASLRGRANFGAFNASKGAQRALAQAMAKEYAADGVHVAHVVIDGPIAGEKIKKGLPEYAERLGEGGMIGLAGIVDAYEFLYDQPPNAWTFELDIRTSLEKW